MTWTMPSFARATVLRVRLGTSVACVALIVATACSGGSGTSSGPTDLPSSKAADLSILAGDWTATPSNARFASREGVWRDATVSLGGNEIVVSYESGLQNGSSSFSASGGPLTIKCSSSGCHWLTLMVQDGPPPYRIVDAVTLTPPGGGCALTPPPEAWVIRDMTDSSFSFTAVVTGGRGGSDGCRDTFQVLWDIDATRRG